MTIDPARPGAAPSGADRAAPWLAALLVAALVGAVHGPVLKAQALAFDDNLYATANPLVTHPGWNSTRRFFVEVLNPSSIGGYYLPLTMTSLMVDYALGGRSTDLTAFHRTNLALHLISTLLVLWILRLLFGSTMLAAGAALLFGLHPLTVEPVAWVSERKTLLATVFALASIGAYVRAAGARRRGWVAVSLLSYLLALLSKPSVVSLPLVLLVLDAWPLRRLRAATVIEKWPYALLTVTSIAVSVASQSGAPIQRTNEGSLLRLPLQIAWALSYYLRKIVWPVDLTPMVVPPASYSLSTPTILSALAVTLACGAAVVLLARRLPGLLAGGLVFLVALLPTFSVMPWSYFYCYDRYVYFPALGLAVGLVGVLAGPVRSRGRTAAAGMMVAFLPIVAAEAAGTRATLAHWRDSVALWTQSARHAPRVPDAHTGLGIAYENRGDVDAAAAEYRRALALDPNNIFALLNLGNLLTTRGDPDAATVPLRRASALAPRDANAAYALGRAELAARRPESAERELRRALALRPDDPATLELLGTALAQRGEMDDGLGFLRRAVALAPASPRFHLSLAAALLAKGGATGEAVSHLRSAVDLQPDWALALNSLAWIRATSSDPAYRDPAEALRLSTRAVELTSRRDASMLDTHAAALAAAGRFAEAATTAREALALAVAGKDTAQAPAIRDRLAAYARLAAYIETHPGR